MNVTLVSLEALILKATHESLACPDAAAMEAFCAVMKDAGEGPQLAAQALAARIHSPNAREAMLALSMLDRCMRRCDAAFHAEVGKFRFLNEMIKLVSPKYFADRTAPEVRTRVLQLLHAWSIEYPKESKFKVAYDMLKNQGVVKETPPPLPPEDTPPAPRTRAKSAIFDDDEKSKLLQKLLQSKKPEDLQHANKLIKTMVREEERRNEVNSRRAQDVTAATDSAGLLRDMLRHIGSASPDERQLMSELHAACLRLRPNLQHLAEDVDQENLYEIIQASDLLDEVCEKYNEYIAAEKMELEDDAPEEPESNSDSLLDLDEYVSDNEEKVDDAPKSNVIDELGDIFSNEVGTSNISNIAEPLKPVSLINNDEVDLLGEKSTKAEGWNELDSLGEQLLKESLPDHARRESFVIKPTKKIPMNALEKSPKRDKMLASNDAILDLDFFTKKTEHKRFSLPVTMLSKPVTTSPPDDVMVDISDAPSTSSFNLGAAATPAPAAAPGAPVAPLAPVAPAPTMPKTSPLDNILDLGIPLVESKCDNEIVANKDADKEKNKEVKDGVKPLTDINVSLESVKPSKVPPRTVFEEDNGLTVVLHFCSDKPRADVNVIVVSTTSKNTSPIEDYKFQAVVPKGYKARLLAASGSSLPAWRPFVPAAGVTQVLLVARRPTAPPPALRFVLTYSCDDDVYSEMGEVDDLPLDHV